MPVRQRGPGRLRHDRVGRGAAVVDRGDRDVRPVLSGRRAVAGGRRVAAAPEGDGAGDDVLDAAATSSTPAGPGTCRGSPGSGTTSRPTRACARTCRARGPARRPRRPGSACEPPLPYRLPLADVPELRERGAVLLRLAGAPARATRGGTGRRSAAGTTGSAPRSSTSRAGTTRRTARRARSRTSSACSRRGRARRTRARSSCSVPGRTAARTPTVPATASSARRRRSTTPELILRFMDRYVRGIDNGVDREPRVRAFVMGENAWRTGETMPLPGTEPARPVPRRRAASSPASPRSPAPQPSSSAFVSDPSKPVVDPYGTKPGAHDYRALAGAPTCSSSRPSRSPKPLRVVGPIDVEMYLSADAPDADLWVLLEDVLPDGTAWNLSSPGTDVLRASDRDGGADAEAARAGRDRHAAPPQPAHGQPLREGPPRPGRPVRQLHAALLPQPADGRVGGALREDARGHDPHPPRRGAPVAHRPAGRARRGTAVRLAARARARAAARALRRAARAGMRMEEVWIPMKDGVRLAATLYRPDAEKRGQRSPVVFEYLPYRKDDGTSPGDYPLYAYMVAHGLHRRPRGHPRHGPQRGAAARPRVLRAGAAGRRRGRSRGSRGSRGPTAASGCGDSRGADSTRSRSPRGARRG